MIQEIADALAQSWHNFAAAFVQFVPRLVAATIIFAGDYAIPQFPHEIPRASSIEEVEAFVRRAIARG